MSLIGNAVVVGTLLGLVLLKICNNGSILAATLFCLLFTYYSSLTLSSVPSNGCNPFTIANTGHSYIYNALPHLIANLALGFLSICYGSTTTHTSKNFREAHISYNHANNTTDASLSSRSLFEDLDVEVIRSRIQKEFTSAVVYESNDYILFHGTMALFSVYLFVIFSDWRGTGQSPWSQLTAPNISSFVIKTFSTVVFLAVYVWTLAAPTFYRER